MAEAEVVWYIVVLMLIMLSWGISYVIFYRNYKAKKLKNKRQERDRLNMINNIIVDDWNELQR